MAKHKVLILRMQCSSSGSGVVILSCCTFWARQLSVRTLVAPVRARETSMAIDSTRRIHLALSRFSVCDMTASRRCVLLFSTF